MRWDAQRIDRADQEALPGMDGPLRQLPGLVRSVRTPEFADLTFHEVRARSIINRVPAASQVPFRWTINPYRGCSHACTYCMAGDTPILMSDGRTRALSDLRPGDRIYGTECRGNDRRYVQTEVLAHWRTVKPAFRVQLEDGTVLLASGEHRFLTDRGWHHVSGSDVGRRRRPHLTTDSRLLDAGKQAIAGGAITGDAPLRVVSVGPLGFDMPMYDITTGTGDFVANGVVSHNCFARKTHTYLDFDAGADFDSQVVVKVNAPELVRRELARRGWAGEHIAMGTNVDCYQRAEGRYALMPGILAALRDAGNPFSILTKGTLILRDLPLLRQSAERADVGLNVSIGFVDRELWRLVEPGTPSPQARLRVVRELTGAGLACGVLMAPILPFLTDAPEQLESTVATLAEAGAAGVTPVVLHLRPGSREWYLRWLAGHRPELVEPYRELYAGGAYAPRAYRRRMAAEVAGLARRYGIAGYGQSGRDRPTKSDESAENGGHRSPTAVRGARGVAENAPEQLRQLPLI